MKQYIELCLVLSHPRPLDIVVDFNVISPDQDQCVQYIDQVLQLLSSHASRWRSVECVGRSLYESNPKLLPPPLDIDARLMDRQLKTLESLTLMFKGKFLHGAMTPIHVPNLRVLKTTITNANVVSQWEHLTTFEGPFEESTSFYDLLSKATNLTSLSATHIGSKDSGNTATSLALLIHNTIRTLHLSECSISPIFDVLTFPSLEEFAIPTLDDWRPTHPNSCNTSDRDVYAILESLIQRSSSPIRFLDIGGFNGDSWKYSGIAGLRSRT